MSKKYKKQIKQTKQAKQTSSIPFSLSQLFRKISTAQPSTFALSVITIASAVFLFGGGVYTLITRPPPSAYYGGKFYFLYPELGQQFISDTVIAAMLYALGFIGLLAIYQSTKSVYKPRQAYMMLIVGVTLLLLAYIFLENAIYWKMNPS